jgi:peroxiredoxin
MPQVTINKPSPDFTLKSFTGETVTLSSYQGEKNVLLVFNRGFT